MDKKIVFITGVSRGIGLEIAKCFSIDDYFVIGTSRSEFNLNEELASEKCLHLALDVTDRDQAASCISMLCEAMLTLSLIDRFAPLEIQSSCALSTASLCPEITV